MTKTVPPNRRLLLLVLAGVAVAAGCGGGGARGHLVQYGGGRAQAATFAESVGHAFTFGDLFVQNRGRTALTLTGVSLVGATKGMRVVGTMVVPGTVDYVLAGDDDFPPASTAAHRDYRGARPLRGYAMRGGASGRSGVQILVGIEQTSPGRGVVRSFAVHYRSGGHSFTTTCRYAIAVCRTRRCRFPPLP